MTVFIITFSLTSKEKYGLRQSCQLKIAQHAFGNQEQEIDKSGLIYNELCSFS